jgi:hypothetical protein
VPRGHWSRWRASDPGQREAAHFVLGPASMLRLARVWAIWFLAPLIITVVHEAGHLIAAMIAGAHPSGMVVGPFGGGRAHYKGDLGPVGQLFALSGGMLMNLATGIAALSRSKRLPPGTWRATIASVLGGLSIVQIAGYVFIGVSRGLGDPARIARLLVPDFFSSGSSGYPLRTLLIIASAASCLLATWSCARSFVRHQHALWPQGRRMNRVSLAGMLVVPFLLMLGLRLWLHDPSGIARQAFSGGPRATMAIMAEIDAAEPDLDDRARFELVLQALGQRRALGPVDNRPDLAWGTVAMAASMCLVGGLAVARQPAPEIPTSSARGAGRRWTRRLRGGFRRRV